MKLHGKDATTQENNLNRTDIEEIPISECSFNKKVKNSTLTHLGLLRMKSMANVSTLRKDKMSSSNGSRVSCKRFTLNESIEMCRICFEKEKLNDPLVFPCSCVGSVKFVHAGCLKQWITNKKLDIDEAFCEICKAKYRIEYEDKHEFNIKLCLRSLVKVLVEILLLISILVLISFGIFKFVSAYLIY